jgi:hypothetical protein
VQLKPGTRVELLTKKVGQRPRTGKVLEVRDHSVEVRWDDDRVSLVEKTSLHAITSKKG